MENKKERKKAQVSLFLVLGLVIVAGSLFVYYIARESVKEVEKPSPPEIVPLKNYVEGCLSQIAVEGLRKLGEHGGYIQPNNPELSKKVFSMATAENNPAEADGISLGAEESFIPYWYYLKSKSNCKRCTLSEENIPSIVEIEQQLDGYIEEQLNSCLNSFKPFLEKKYEIKQTDRRIIRTTITEQEILIELGFPLEIKRGDQKFEITDFSTTIPYNFIKIYNEALTIIDFEEQTQALEFVSMRLVSAFSAPDAGKLPPIASIDENYYYTTWTLPSVELDLRDLLTVYINSVAINNSKTSPLKGDNEIEQKFYDSMHWNVFNETMNEKIEFLYLNWPIYLDITPRSGFLLRPSSIKHSYPSYLAPTQTNYYEFYYDISYPAVVAITDSNAPFGEYRFMFAIESNVRDNKNMLEWLSGNGTITWDPSFVTLKANSQSGMSQQEINNLAMQSLMCDEQQRLSGDITIRTFDTETQRPLPDVSITFGCGNYRSCPFEPTNSEGVFLGKLPICIGSGYLLLEKQGYRPKTVPFEATQKNKAVIAELENYKKIKVDAKIIDVLFDYNKGTVYPSEPRGIGINEQIALTLAKTKESLFGQEYSQLAVLDSNRQEAEMLLFSGDFELEASLFSKKEIVINPGCQQVCVEKNSKGECTRRKGIPEQQLILKNPQVGGIHKNITIIPGNMNKKITFYIIRFPQPVCTASEECTLYPCFTIDEMGKSDFYSELFKNKVAEKYE